MIFKDRFKYVMQLWFKIRLLKNGKNLLINLSYIYFISFYIINLLFCLFNRETFLNFSGWLIYENTERKIGVLEIQCKNFFDETLIFSVDKKTRWVLVTMQGEEIGLPKNVPGPIQFPFMLKWWNSRTKSLSWDQTERLLTKNESKFTIITKFRSNENGAIFFFKVWVIFYSSFYSNKFQIYITNVNLRS